MNEPPKKRKFETIQQEASILPSCSNRMYWANASLEKPPSFQIHPLTLSSNISPRNAFRNGEEEKNEFEKDIIDLTQPDEVRSVKHLAVDLQRVVLGDGNPRTTQCKICSSIVGNPLLVPCCQQLFCRKCVLLQIDNCCRNCGKNYQRSDIRTLYAQI